MAGTVPEGIPAVKRTMLPPGPEASRTLVDGALTVVDVPDLAGRSRIGVLAPQWLTAAEALALARLLTTAASGPRG